MSNQQRLLAGIGILLAICIGWIVYSSKNPDLPRPMTAFRGLKTGVGGGYAEEAYDTAEYGMAASGIVAMPSVARNSAMMQQKPFAPEQDRKIIRNGALSMVVEDVYAAIQSVGDFVKQKGGFIVSSNVSKEGIAPVGTITVRVPAKDLDTAIAEAKKLGEVKHESVNGQDVTEEFVDIESQLRNLRASETQLLSIMQRSGTIADVLAVQRELTQVRAQIEQYEGRKKYLSQSVDYSLLSVTFSTDPDALPVVDEQDKWKPLAVVKDAFRSLLELGKKFVNAIIWILVFAPVVLLVVLVAWLVRRRMMRKQM